jgi:hypothetical protein
MKLSSRNVWDDKQNIKMMIKERDFRFYKVVAIPTLSYGNQ